MNFDPSSAQPDTSVFDPTTAMPEGTPPVREALRQAVKIKPDTAAEVERLAKRYPAPYEVIERNVADFQTFDMAEGIAENLQGAPTLSGVVRQNPRFAALSHDDIGVLTKIEQAVRYVVGADASKGKSTLIGDVGAGATTLGLGATVGVGKTIFDITGATYDILGWDSGAADMRVRAKRAGEAMDAYGMQADSSTGKAVKAGLQSAGANLAMLPIGLERSLFATANQAATTVATMMGTGVGAAAYNEARDAGKGKVASAAYGIPQGVFEFVFEKIPAGKLFGDLAANTSLLKTLRTQAISEGWTEQVTTLAQDFNTWANMNPEKTLGDFIAERPEAAYQTFIATLVGVGVQTSAIRGIDKIVEQASDKRLSFVQDQFAEQMKLSGQSLLRERSPEQFRQFVQQAVDSDPGTSKSIHVDGQVLATLPEDVFNQLPESVRAQVREAALSGGTVEIPMADVLTVAPGTPLEELLNEHARMTPEALSKADAKAAGDQAQVLRQEAERVIQQAQDQEAAQAEYDTVQAIYRDQLTTAGRTSPAVADMQAHWIASFYTAYGSRTGMTPTQMQAAYPMRVMGTPTAITGPVMDTAQLEQITPEQAVETNVPVKMPTVPEFSAAVANTPGAQVTADGLMMDLVRFQKEEQEGAQAIRTGVFYLPAGSPNAKHYRVTPTTKSPNAYGGTEKMTGPTLIRRPLFVKGSTGGKAPEAAYDAIKGKGAMKKLDSAVMEVVTSRGWMNKMADDLFEERVQQFLQDNGGQPGLAWEIIQNSKQGNTLRYALQEHVIANVVRAAGYDAVVGYSKGKAGPSIAEVFDVREQTYPARGMESQVHDDFYKQGPRGTFNPATLELVLNPNANLSTWFHETGHFFLEVMADIASQPNAPAQIVEDMNTFLKWGGITGDEAVGEGDAGGVLGQADDSVELDALTRSEQDDIIDALQAGRSEVFNAAVPDGMRDDDLRSELIGIVDAPRVQRLSLAPSDISAVDRQTSPAAVAKYAKLRPESQPAILVAKDGAGWKLIEGGHRLAASLARGDTSVSAIDVSTLMTMNWEAYLAGDAYQQDPNTQPTSTAQPLPKRRTPLEVWNAMTLDEKRPYHERWAESIEQYVMEGKVPNKELQPLMRRFAAWLKSVYGSIQKFLTARGQVVAAGDALNQVDTVAQAQAEGYEGVGAGEAAEWLAAKAKGLDMSEAARMERARAMGFDTSKTLYHSTLADTQQFASVGKFMGFTGTSGISVTDSPEMASRYLDRYAEYGWVDGKPDQPFSKNVIPVFIKPGMVLERDEPFPMRPGMGLGAPLPPGYVPEHKRMGYDTLVRNDAISRKGEVKHSTAKNAIKGKEYVLTDPSQVRSVFAAFDPHNAASGNLLAQDPNAQPGPQMALNDDIRRVMDRMLATDEQIAQANEAAGLLPDLESDETAAERLNKRSMRDLALSVKARDRAIADLRKEAKAWEKDIREQVTVEVDVTPEMRAKTALDALKVNPEYDGVLAAHKTQRAGAETAARERIKAALLDANPEAKGLIKGQLLAKNKRDIENKVDAEMIKWDAANPRPSKASYATEADVATVADSFGYETVDAMLQAIDAYGSRKDAIDGLTEKRMLEEHGDLIDERAIREAANEAVHNEARARSLATELRTQREMLNPRADTGRTTSAGAKITTNALVDAAKQFAANVVGKTPLSDLTNRAWQHTAAERRASKRWQEATAAGKTQEAVQAKQDQMLQNAAAKAAVEAKAEMGKTLEFFKRVIKGNDEKTVERGRDPDIVNAARAVLARYGIETPTTKSAAEYLEVVQRQDPETYAVLAPMVEAASTNAQPIGALTVDELQALRDEIDGIWHLSKRSRQMEVDGDLLDIEDAAHELHGRLEEVGIPDEIPGETGALTRKDERARWLQFAGALLRRVEQWAEGIDGKYGGPFLRYVFQPVKDAADRYRTDRLEYRKKYQALIDAVAPSMRHELIAAPELGYTFGRGHNGIGTAELLHAILHTGNESNKRKLLLGRQWGSENPDGTLDTSKWDAFIRRLANEGVLTPAHFDFAQGVWDLLEETKPLAQKTHRDVFGRYFNEVTADAFVDPFGAPWRGGYVPAQADPAIVQDASIRALAEMENESMAYSFPTTSKGFTKSRVEYNRPLKLDLRTIPQHIDKVLLFSHMESAVRGVSKLLRQRTVSQPLGRIDPSAYEGMLLPWLNRSAKQIVETPILGDGKTSRVLSALRARAGAALMFANISNTVQQLTGFSTAAVKVKPAQLMRGAAAVIAHPKQTREAVANASDYMANRMSNEVAAMTDAMNDILLNPSLYEKAQAWSLRHSYFLQSALDNAMSPMIWTGAYNQALEEGMDERMAVRFADGVIRQTQGANSPEDVSRIETGPAYARIFTQFIGYFNMLANTNGTALKQIAGEMGLKKGAGKALGVVFFGMLAPIWIAEAIALAFKGGPEDKEHDGYLDDWLAAVFGMGTIKGTLAQVPFVAQLGQVVVNRFNTNPADDRFSLSPAVSLLESAASVPYDVYKQIKDGERTQKLVRDAAALVSLATGLPASALARPFGYAAGVADDKIRPTSAADAVRGAVTGTASPESKRP